MYTSKHLAALFHVTVETIRLWAIEFASYLSPTAQPGTKKPRYFTQSDLDTLTLVADMKAHGKTFTEIHATLQAGQRGNATVQSPDDIDDLTAPDATERLAMELRSTRQQLTEMRAELDRQRQVAEQVTVTREENIRLTARMEAIEQERVRLEQRIDELITAQTQAYAQGFKDGFRENTTPAHE